MDLAPVTMGEQGSKQIAVVGQTAANELKTLGFRPSLRPAVVYWFIFQIMYPTKLRAKKHPSMSPSRIICRSTIP